MLLYLCFTSDVSLRPSRSSSGNCFSNNQELDFRKMEDHFYTTKKYWWFLDVGEVTGRVKQDCQWHGLQTTQLKCISKRLQCLSFRSGQIWEESSKWLSKSQFHGKTVSINQFLVKIIFWKLAPHKCVAGASYQKSGTSMPSNWIYYSTANGAVTRLRTRLRAVKRRNSYRNFSNNIMQKEAMNTAISVEGNSCSGKWTINSRSQKNIMDAKFWN